jgi:hypothetical protein
LHQLRPLVIQPSLSETVSDQSVDRQLIRGYPTETSRFIRWKKYRSSGLSDLTGVHLHRLSVQCFCNRNKSAQQSAEVFMSDKRKKLTTSNPDGLEDVSATQSISEEEFKSIDSAQTVTKTLRVSVGNFIGDLTFSYWWKHGGGLFYCYSSQYRITQLVNQGGNKANLHFSFDSRQWWGNDSPDAMWQDGEWHSYPRGGWIAANGRARVFIRYIFDKGGADPVGSNEIWVDFSI